MQYLYDEENDELGRGGMAVVYAASHPDFTGVVALKRPLPWPQAADRLRREIEALTAVDHAHVMPVLAHGVDDDGEPWYTMPLAMGSLKNLWEDGRLGDDAEAVCSDVLDGISSGLAAMHEAGYVHRDVTPNNALAFHDPDRASGVRWVIADCGLARRPLGDSTEGLTGSVSRLGTDGYMAPEGFGAPHLVTESADVYSLGRILAWLLTGVRPSLVTPLLPAAGPWRAVVRAFTRNNPDERPQSMPAAVERARTLLSSLPTSDKVDFRVHVGKNEGQLPPNDQMWTVVEDQIRDRDFMIDDLVLIRASAARALAEERPEVAAMIAEQLAQHLTNADWTGRSFDSANAPLNWIKAVLEGLLAAGRVDLFGDTAPAYCEAVKTWDRYPHNGRLVPWLASMQAPFATSMARAIQDSGTTEYFRTITDGRRVSDTSLAALLQK